jgi:hypothetical protein
MFEIMKKAIQKSVAALFLVLLPTSLLSQITVKWDSNSETDLAGYILYIGEQAGNYTGFVDVGRSTEKTWNSLEQGKTYYFAVTAYDYSGNESGYSEEIKWTIAGSPLVDNNPPELIDVNVLANTQIDVIFSEPLDQASAQDVTNYTISDGIEVTLATLDANRTVVHLLTTAHPLGESYLLTVAGLQDLNGNPVAEGSAKSYQMPAPPNEDTTPPRITAVSIESATSIDITFSEALELSSAEDLSNYQINNGIQVRSAQLDAGQKIVHLTTSDHVTGEFAVTVNGVRDQASVPNTIAANSQRTYRYTVPEPVETDRTPPALIDVVVNGATQIDLHFDEPVTSSSIQNKTSFIISPAVEVKGAAISDNGKIVYLITGSHAENVNYSISVVNIQDLAGNPVGGSGSKSYIFKAEVLFPQPTTPPEDPGQVANPNSFALFQNYPNPFNPETEIRFFLDKERPVELKIYNLLGQAVRTLAAGELEQGYHTMMWDGRNQKGIQVPSGIYIYSLAVDREVAKGDLLVNVSVERRVRRMTLLR